MARQVRSGSHGGRTTAPHLGNHPYQLRVGPLALGEPVQLGSQDVEAFLYAGQLLKKRDGFLSAQCELARGNHDDATSQPFQIVLVHAWDASEHVFAPPPGHPRASAPTLAVWTEGSGQRCWSCC